MGGTAFSTEGIFQADASQLIGEADAAGGSLEELGGDAEATSESLFELDPAGAAAGAGLAAVGTGAQGVLDDTQPMRESLGRTAQTMGMTTDEANQLARSLSNATFPVEDATATMDVLAQAGVTSEEAMVETANAADMVADATGNSAESIANNAVPALRAMGRDASDLNENMDTFTFIARETTMSVDDFSRVVTKTGPEIQELGLGVDETATIMAALEEKGLDSRTAMREFRQAANEAEGDQQAFMEALGLSNDELAAQEQALQNAEGSTQAHAEAANESLSVMDELRAGFEDVKLAAGGMVQPISAAGPAMQGLGGAAITMSTINFSAVIPSLAGVVAAISPLLPLILGGAAVIGVLAAAWETNFLGIQNVTQDVIGALGGAFDFLTGVVSDAVNFVLDAFAEIPNVLADAIDAIPGVDSEDILGDIDTDEIEKTLFPPKPGEQGEEVGESAGEGMVTGMAAGVQSGLPGGAAFDPGGGGGGGGAAAGMMANLPGVSETAGQDAGQELAQAAAGGTGGGASTGGAARDRGPIRLLVELKDEMLDARIEGGAENVVATVERRTEMLGQRQTLVE